MTPELRQFLTEWYEWATGDAVERKPFWRGLGLCGNAPRAVLCELEALLRAEYGCTSFPFGAGDYWTRYGNDTQHLCPKRLAWVREKLGLPDPETIASEADYRADQARDRAMIERWEREREQGDVL